MSFRSGKNEVVPKGGFWNCPHNGPISAETKELLSALMSEAKLTLLQRKEIQENIGRGNSLPTRLTQHSPKEKPQKPTPKQHQIGSGLRCREKVLQMEEPCAPCLCTVLPNREKERLQNVMAYGKDIVPKLRSDCFETTNE